MTKIADHYKGFRGPKPKDHTGLTYGRLTVREFHSRDRRHGPKWLCDCACGNESVVLSSNLTAGQTNSCGCLHREAMSRNARKAIQGHRDAAQRRREGVRATVVALLAHNLPTGLEIDRDALARTLVDALVAARVVK